MADEDSKETGVAKTTGHRRGERLLKWSLVAPVLLFLIAINIFPLLYTIGLSFTNARLTSPKREMVGGKNYRRIFNTKDYPKYRRSLETTLMFVCSAVTVELILGFVLALALKDKFRGKAAVLAILLIPMMLSPAVIGIFWNYMLDPQFGVVNQALGAMGLAQPNWSQNWKFIVVLIIDVWMWTPFMMLISMAALNSIPEHIYEAAEIDQASRWTVFRRITLPMCAPLLMLAVLLRTTDALKQFDLVMSTSGANDSATETLSTLMYSDAILPGKIGLGGAFACVVLVIVITVATVFTRYLAYIQRQQGKEA